MARFGVNAPKRGIQLPGEHFEPSLKEMRIILTVFEFAGVDDERDIF
jgi:hypothetical protein